MAFDNKPTEAQIGLLYRWFKWKMPIAKANHALNWLENHATRREVSQEIDRVGKLFHEINLDEQKCFDSPIWDGYKCNASEGEADNA